MLNYYKMMLQTIYTIKNEYQLFHQSIDNG